MSRIVYVDGRYVPASQAVVAMEDRGYQFADGIYEAIASMHGALIDIEAHLDRLERSLAQLEIPVTFTRASLIMKMRELMRRNHRDHGVIYLQITRGVAPRNHIYSDSIKPVLTMALMPPKFRSAKESDEGVRVTTAPDIRWSRCDIKAIALLPNMLARMQSYRAGAKETWQIRDGVITEGALSNAYIIDAEGVIRTHPATHAILGGVRRQALLQIARDNGFQVREEAFTLDDIKHAREAFISSCSSFVTPVVQVDDQVIGNGAVGLQTAKLIELFDAYVEAQVAAHQRRAA